VGLLETDLHVSVVILVVLTWSDPSDSVSYMETEICKPLQLA
jgi:hypothetical protein